MKTTFTQEEWKSIFKLKPFQLKRIRHQITIGCNRILKEYGKRKNRRTAKSTDTEEDY